jgi:hypothetical protein
MMKINDEIRLHLSHYLVLLVILSTGVQAFLFLDFNRIYQLIIILATSFTYVIWGIVHHWFCEDLHFKVIAEYLALAVLADTMIFFLIFRA